jgi:antitoxin component of RelBE/YafQ-DinJ toxin-antitoxin module
VGSECRRLDSVVSLRLTQKERDAFYQKLDKLGTSVAEALMPTVRAIIASRQWPVRTQ